MIVGHAQLTLSCYYSDDFLDAEPEYETILLLSVHIQSSKMRNECVVKNIKSYVQTILRYPLRSLPRQFIQIPTVVGKNAYISATTTLFGALKNVLSRLINLNTSLLFRKYIEICTEELHECVKIGK